MPRLDRRTPFVLRCNPSWQRLSSPARPTAAEQKRDEFYWLSEMNKASAVIGGRAEDRAAIAWGADRQSGREGHRRRGKAGARRSRDYLQVEKLLIAIGGPDVTRLHSGRSRQDIGSTSRRLFMRDDVLAAYDRLAHSREFAHRLRAEAPERDRAGLYLGRAGATDLVRHYRSPMRKRSPRRGAAARSLRARETSRHSAPPRSARRASQSTGRFVPGCSASTGVVENSLDANQISPVDAGAEVVGIAASSALTINLMLADITVQYAQTKPWLLLAEGELTGVSSIMPQKRNPTGLIDTRIQASKVLGGAQTYWIARAQRDGRHARLQDRSAQYRAA